VYGIWGVVTSFGVVSECLAVRRRAQKPEQAE